MIGINDIKNTLRLDEESGDLYWKSRQISMFADLRSFRTWNSRFSDELALISINKFGYKYGSIFSKKILSHRVVWALVHGVIPDHQIDHINGNTLDNRPCNLRMCTNSQNQWNKDKNSNNTSGYKGVSFHKQSGRWRASIRKNGMLFHLGVFDNPLDASRAYENNSVAMHGEFSFFSGPK